ncbi:DUF4312 family protein [Lactococcus fujiensis]|uniref:Cytoplasmic protein n=1 Tax=Lactococcus fujiensis JCM 16395 TaxID=1291764 RepID=A0A2A5RQ58_9LACT|nr:DUF4312 family protein [Lactococcus fujiensis]PCS01519.1 hypothetical protein RT41_GL000283 [Lactococcus fujiensis JCM 16395]
MIKTVEKVIVSGTGKSKNEAFAAALNQIQTEILKNTNDVILRIEPEEIKIIKAEEKVWREKFLFFFFPRTRSEFSIKLEAQVQCARLLLNDIEFEINNENPEGIKIPLINKTI